MEQYIEETYAKVLDREQKSVRLIDEYLDELFEHERDKIEELFAELSDNLEDNAKKLFESVKKV